MTQPAYAELDVMSCFSFLRGASHPEELVVRAGRLGLSAVGLCDYNSVAGMVRAHTAAKEHGIRLVVGARLVLDDGTTLLCYPTDRAAYGRLTSLLSVGGMAGSLKDKVMTRADVLAHAGGQICILLPPDEICQSFAESVSHLAHHWGDRLYLAVEERYRPGQGARLSRVSSMAREAGIALVATGGVLYHVRERKPLYDVMTCIRLGTTLAGAGLALQSDDDRALKSPRRMCRRLAGYDQSIVNGLDIVRRCRFSLDELRYQYPHEPTPVGRTPDAHLGDLVWAGARCHYGERIPSSVRALIRKELSLISALDYARYFLTVHDVVAFARQRGIFCQGRGSAANSAVCFCLGVTSVDPADSSLLFERFLSKERDQPPDIDIDFEHQRREEVIQYVYRRYGRHRAALTATVICYRTRSAVREVCKVFGLSEDIAAALARNVWGRDDRSVSRQRLVEAGLDPDDILIRTASALIGELTGFPRHLSQHVGGFVLTGEPLTETVPVGKAAMDQRSCIEWDKDDIDALGIMKVDILSLGMLTCIRRCFDLVARHGGGVYDMASVPADDGAVYDMLCAGDSVGVFQVESRAQMSMLPRLRPRCFYDLVIEVAIVRPGPIQGDMVHPYLRRRDGLEPVVFPSPSPDHGRPDELHAILQRTLGVPLFQEQAMQIAIDAAGFSGDQANGLRCAMATFRRAGIIHEYEQAFIDGMTQRGYELDFARRCFDQIRGFGEYGFPESHSASFALLVYVSSWLKCHHPAAFTAALLNSQPMGFYAPAQLIRDARAHQVEVRPADVNASDWDCTLEARSDGSCALRLGLSRIEGLNADRIKHLCARRGEGYAGPEDVFRRTGLDRASLETLARADAFASTRISRRQALWSIRALGETPPLLTGIPACEPHADVRLPQMSLPFHVGEDYRSMRLSLRGHPMQFMRRLHDGILAAADAVARPDGSDVSIAGIVICRQKPGTAKGVAFITLEDETGIANLIVWPDVFRRYRPVIMSARVVRVRGRVQKVSGVVHIIVSHLSNHNRDLALFSAGQERAGRGGGRVSGHPRAVRIIPKSRDFH